MNKFQKTILILFLILFAVSYLFYLNQKQETILPTKNNMKVIELKQSKDTFFLSARIWGIAGNHMEIVLSQSSNNLHDKELDYIFYTSEVFYKVENDSNIILYAPECDISEPLNKIPNVTIKGLKKADEISNYNRNYKKYGLSRISVY